uniref:Replication-associated protein n=1 Tax=Syrmaticus reevesii CRESS-DNA-virus sp. TaxID=2815059 RepID=A0A8A4XCN7_9VIRU|nr:MAG: replication-associated protein [Syrmaticus reevesii CRESS-DNA-virus sp.]
MPSSFVVWDFTINNVDDWPWEAVKRKLKMYCKKWCFQKEKVTREHWQGRVSLKVRKSTRELVQREMDVDWYFTLTSTENRDNAFYCMKTESRIDGPWADTDVEIYIPRQYRMLADGLRPFQREIYDSREVFEPRKVNVIYDPKGCTGKSTLASWMECQQVAIDMPPCNDGEKLISALCDICMATENRAPGVVFVDLPRSMDQKKLFGLYTAIEQIKKGKLYDFRYSYKTWWIDSPQIWVFCNSMPELGYVSRDRWKFFQVSAEFALVEMSHAEIATALESESDGAASS